VSNYKWKNEGKSVHGLLHWQELKNITNSSLIMTQSLVIQWRWQFFLYSSTLHHAISKKKCND